MATAKKLPSGSWRVQIFSHYEYTPDGKKKRIYESFTCDDPSPRGKKEAERMAAEWSADRETARPENITVYEAVSKYIELKEPVLSPSTIKTYRSMQKTYFTQLSSVPVRKLNTTTAQAWVSRLSSTVSAKTVHNAYTLLSSTMEMFAPDTRLRVTLPQKQPTHLYTPNDKDIAALLDHIQGTELEIAVLLAAFGPLRRSEICALESTDIDGATIHVHHGLVRDPAGGWTLKAPKTPGSDRYIEMPGFVIDKIKDIDGRIVKANPDLITGRFRRAVKAAGLPHFRFHDLRHYSASIMHAIGVPDQYIMARGGWKTDAVMKTVYRNVIDLEAVKQTRHINEHFEAVQHDMQHEK